MRGIGPLLRQSGLSNLLADPILELRDSNGALLISSDNWQGNPTSAAQLTAHGLAPQTPSNPESWHHAIWRLHRYPGWKERRHWSWRRRDLQRAVVLAWQRAGRARLQNHKLVPKGIRPSRKRDFLPTFPVHLSRISQKGSGPPWLQSFATRAAVEDRGQTLPSDAPPAVVP